MNLSLDLQPLGWRVDPGGGWFERRFWRLFDEAFWIGMESAVEDFLASCVDLVGLTIVDLVRHHQADARVMMIPIIPIEEGAAERLCVLDAAEPLRKLGLVFQGFEMTFRERVVV